MVEWGEVPTDALVGLVKASQKHQRAGCHGSWLEFVKVHAPKGSGTDPARQSREVLQAFAESILSPPEGTPAGEGGAFIFVNKYLNYARTVREEQEDDCDVLPEASTSGSSQNTVWSLVRRTRAHGKYAATFNLPSYLPGWKRTKRQRLNNGAQPQLLGLDCEMCATDDDDDALLGVCLVDESGRELYRRLVRPPGTIKDLRTQLTGITEEEIKAVTLTAEQASSDVRKLIRQHAKACSANGTHGAVVLVGHALHHDLRALRIDHQPIIDTSLIFAFRGMPDCAPGLKDLAKQVLGLDIRGEGGQGRHDSLEDASAAVKLVQHELQLSAPTPPLEPPSHRVPPEELRKLLVHSIPAAGVSEQQLRQAVAAAGAPAPEGVDGDPSRERKVHLVFKHAGDANEAFKRLAGPQGKDSWGRSFKEVMVGPGVAVKVRKMAAHNGMSMAPSDAGPSNASPASGSSGNLKAPSSSAANGKQADAPAAAAGAGPACSNGAAGAAEAGSSPRPADAAEAAALPAVTSSGKKKKDGSLDGGPAKKPKLAA